MSNATDFYKLNKITKAMHFYELYLTEKETVHHVNVCSILLMKRKLPK